MAYLTYEEYVILGGVYDEAAFNRNIDRACATIDRATYNRVVAMREVPRRVKALCRDLVEYYATHADVSKQNVSTHTESAGTVSESVSYAAKSSSDFSFDIEELILDHLYTLTDDKGTPLLYKGAKT